MAPFSNDLVFFATDDDGHSTEETTPLKLNDFHHHHRAPMNIKETTLKPENIQCEPTVTQKKLTDDSQYSTPFTLYLSCMVAVVSLAYKLSDGGLTAPLKNLDKVEPAVRDSLQQDFSWMDCVWLMVLVVEYYLFNRLVAHDVLKWIPVTTMVLYHSYIILDHSTVIFTNTLFETAEMHYRNIPLTLFWGNEWSSAILAWLNGAPWYVLMNVPNHIFFLISNFNGVDTSVYFEVGIKPWWLNFAVMADCSVHCACIYHWLSHVWNPKLVRRVVAPWVASMVLITLVYHQDKIHVMHALTEFVSLVVIV